MKHPGEVNARYDQSRIQAALTDARVNQTLAEARADRAEERSRFRAGLAAMIGIAALAILLWVPIGTYYQNEVQPRASAVYWFVENRMIPDYSQWCEFWPQANSQVCLADYLFDYLEDQYRVVGTPQPALPTPTAPVASPTPAPTTSVPQTIYYPVYPTWIGSLELGTNFVRHDLEYLGNYTLASVHTDSSYFWRHDGNVVAHDCFGKPVALKVGMLYWAQKVTWTWDPQSQKFYIQKVQLKEIGCA